MNQSDHIELSNSRPADAASPPEGGRPGGLRRARLPLFGKRRAGFDPTEMPWQRHLTRHGRAIRRVLWLVVLLPVCCAIQAGLLLAAPRAAREFGMHFWRWVNQALGLRTRIVGSPAGSQQPGARRVIYVANHSSWLDIAALGARLDARFVSKDDVGSWPLIGTVARLGGTVFVSRSRTRTGAERDVMEERLAQGHDLILFPEGTSSDGSRVLPFRSSFFAPAFGQEKPLIQPVSVVYDRLGGLPVGRASRAVFAWYGDMSLVPHLFQVAQFKGKRVTLLFHDPLDPADFADRKALSAAVHAIVAEGAAELRQNRPARPLPRPQAEDGTAAALAGARGETAADEAFA